MKSYLIVTFIISILLFNGCSNEEQVSSTDLAKNKVEVKTAQKIGCKRCHEKIILDKPHNISCVSCHGGNNQSTSVKESHLGLITRPAHPDYMVDICGQCHLPQTQTATENIHYTLENKVNLIRQHFGADKKLSSLTEIQQHQSIETPL
ncbi:MAG: hypothetical protein GY705_06490, partial [Bacteroidetes bacterium]|nr:hypothetical protein [Bacteroidota bacterium]